MAKVNKGGYISYKIKIGGKEYVSSGPIISIQTFCEINRIPTATLILVDGDPSTQTFELSSDTNLDPGKEIEIELGYKGTNKPLFKGIIVRHSIKSSGALGIYLKIECKHSALKMTLGRKVRYFEEKDDKAIITELFKDNKLTGVTYKGEFIKNASFLQFDITDWDFMMTRCEANSKLVLFDVDKVIVDDAKISGEPVQTYFFGKDIIEFESEVDTEHQLQKVESYSWDSNTQKVISSVAKPSDFKQLENKGVKQADLKALVSPTSYELFHGGEMVKAELDGWGKAKFTKSSLSKIKGRLKIVGDNSLKLGDVIEIKGIGDKFSGKVLITALRNDYSESGWVTDIQFGLTNTWLIEKPNVNSLPAGGLNSAVHGLQIGKVLKIDGDDQHRVQIALPIGGEKAKIWARMAFGDAGNKRGHIFWPEKDDEVIVGFLNDDPRNPIILGSLYSKKNVPAIKPDAKNPEKGFISKSDVRIVINDEDKSVVIKTPGGNSVTIDDKKKSIEIADQHKNVIKMAKAGITITSKGDITLDATKKINLKAKADVAIEGMNVKIKAKTKFAAEGAAGADIKSSAIASVKGSMVKIN
ncbi:type VI secretion system tip protein VgrG [Vicingaceae bacterium]|nr:type VI secretion system tip protein VgrG [Vicingaceae bacterium]